MRITCNREKKQSTLSTIALSICLFLGVYLSSIRSTMLQPHVTQLIIFDTIQNCTSNYSIYNHIPHQNHSSTRISKSAPNTTPSASNDKEIQKEEERIANISKRLSEEVEEIVRNTQANQEETHSERSEDEVSNIDRDEIPEELTEAEAEEVEDLRDIQANQEAIEEPEKEPINPEESPSGTEEEDNTRTIEEENRIKIEKSKHDVIITKEKSKKESNTINTENSVLEIESPKKENISEIKDNIAKAEEDLSKKKMINLEDDATATERNIIIDAEENLSEREDDIIDEFFLVLKNNKPNTKDNTITIEKKLEKRDLSKHHVIEVEKHLAEIEDSIIDTESNLPKIEKPKDDAIETKENISKRKRKYSENSGVAIEKLIQGNNNATETEIAMLLNNTEPKRLRLSKIEQEASEEVTDKEGDQSIALEQENTNKEEISNAALCQDNICNEENAATSNECILNSQNTIGQEDIINNDNLINVSSHDVNENIIESKTNSDENIPTSNVTADTTKTSAPIKEENFSNNVDKKEDTATKPSTSSMNDEFTEESKSSEDDTYNSFDNSTDNIRAEEPILMKRRTITTNDVSLNMNTIPVGEKSTSTTDLQINSIDTSTDATTNTACGIGVNTDNCSVNNENIPMHSIRNIHHASKSSNDISTLGLGNSTNSTNRSIYPSQSCMNLNLDSQRECPSNSNLKESFTRSASSLSNESFVSLTPSTDNSPNKKKPELDSLENEISYKSSSNNSLHRNLITYNISSSLHQYPSLVDSVIKKIIVESIDVLYQYSYIKTHNNQIEMDIPIIFKNILDKIDCQKSNNYAINPVFNEFADFILNSLDMYNYSSSFITDLKNLIIALQTSIHTITFALSEAIEDPFDDLNPAQYSVPMQIVKTKLKIAQTIIVCGPNKDLDLTAVIENPNMPTEEKYIYMLYIYLRRKYNRTDQTHQTHQITDAEKIRDLLSKINGAFSTIFSYASMAKIDVENSKDILKGLNTFFKMQTEIHNKNTRMFMESTPDLSTYVNNYNMTDTNDATNDLMHSDSMIGLLNVANTLSHALRPLLVSVSISKDIINSHLTSIPISNPKYKVLIEYIYILDMTITSLNPVVSSLDVVGVCYNKTTPYKLTLNIPYKYLYLYPILINCKNLGYYITCINNQIHKNLADLTSDNFTPQSLKEFNYHKYEFVKMVRNLHADVTSIANILQTSTLSDLNTPIENELSKIPYNRNEALTMDEKIKQTFQDNINYLSSILRINNSMNITLMSLDDDMNIPDKEIYMCIEHSLIESCFMTSNIVRQDPSICEVCKLLHTTRMSIHYLDIAFNKIYNWIGLIEKNNIFNDPIDFLWTLEQSQDYTKLLKDLSQVEKTFNEILLKEDQDMLCLMGNRTFTLTELIYGITDLDIIIEELSNISNGIFITYEKIMNVKANYQTRMQQTNPNKNEEKVEKIEEENTLPKQATDDFLASDKQEDALNDFNPSQPAHPANHSTESSSCLESSNDVSHTSSPITSAPLQQVQNILPIIYRPINTDISNMHIQTSSDDLAAPKPTTSIIPENRIENIIVSQPETQNRRILAIDTKPNVSLITESTSTLPLVLVNTPPLLQSPQISQPTQITQPMQTPTDNLITSLQTENKVNTFLPETSNTSEISGSMDRLLTAKMSKLPSKKHSNQLKTQSMPNLTEERALSSKIEKGSVPNLVKSSTMPEDKTENIYPTAKEHALKNTNKENHPKQAYKKPSSENWPALSATLDEYLKLEEQKALLNNPVLNVDVLSENIETEISYPYQEVTPNLIKLPECIDTKPEIEEEDKETSQIEPIGLNGTITSLVHKKDIPSLYTLFYDDHSNDSLEPLLLNEEEVPYNTHDMLESTEPVDLCSNDSKSSNNTEADPCSNDSTSINNVEADSCTSDSKSINNVKESIGIDAKEEIYASNETIYSDSLNSSDANNDFHNDYIHLHGSAIENLLDESEPDSMSSECAHTSLSLDKFSPFRLSSDISSEEEIPLTEDHYNDIHISNSKRNHLLSNAP
ncbi:hypothetical protein NEOKW01_1727 [Nematocida sp. AWRm80]|nr:hypothetical protein NEOKW01_1727 [Nematocida sp. AWRm80]